MEENDIVTEDVEENDDYNLLVNSTTSNKLNRGDTGKLLSIPSKGSSMPSSTKKIVNKS